MTNTARELIDFIAHQLDIAGIRYTQQRSVRGFIPDFIIEAQNRGLIIIEAKTWDKKAGFTNRAIEQARLYKEAIDAEKAFVVIDSLERSQITKGLVTKEKIAEVITNELKNLENKKHSKSHTIKGIQNTIFAAMPFEEKYDDVYFVAMTYAAEKVGATCIRVDLEQYSGNIVAEVKKLIESASAVIIDLSESKPNVLFEAGYAHALKKPVVHICSTDLTKLPFDVAQDNTLKYEIGQTHKFRNALAKHLSSVIV